MTLRAGGKLDSLIGTELQRVEPELKKPLSDLEFKYNISVAELESILQPIGRSSAQIDRQFFPRVNWIAFSEESTASKTTLSIMSIMSILNPLDTTLDPSPEEELMFNEVCDILIMNVKELRARIGIHTVQVLAAIEEVITSQVDAVAQNPLHVN
jgi:hypothetical protein